MKHFSFSTEFPYSAEEVFDWHLNKGAIERMVPPWHKLVSLQTSEEGSEIVLKVKCGPLPFQWRLRQTRPFLFECSTIQISGPFQNYRHRCRVIPKGKTCILSEEVEYALFFMSDWVERELCRVFSWRHAVLREDLKLYHSHKSRILRILLSGSSGLIGSHLNILLQTFGHQVVRLVRGQDPQREDAIRWEPSRALVLCQDFEGFDAVIHLAGENIGKGRWTEARKKQIFESRCRDTWLLAQTLCRLQNPPKTVISASAIGFYGSRGLEKLTEKSEGEEGFLADLCRTWEKATDVLEQKQIRVVHPRFSMVLSRKGGALAQMLWSFRLGLGGRLGRGDQIVSWVGIDDAIGALYHMLVNEELSGPVNIAAPLSLPQREFANILAHKLHRPAWTMLPKALIRLIFKEMADELLLASADVKPEKLLSSGYAFRYPDLKTALKFVM